MIKKKKVCKSINLSSKIKKNSLKKIGSIPLEKCKKLLAGIAKSVNEKGLNNLELPLSGEVNKQDLKKMIVEKLDNKKLSQSMVGFKLNNQQQQTEPNKIERKVEEKVEIEAVKPTILKMKKKKQKNKIEKPTNAVSTEEEGDQNWEEFSEISKDVKKHQLYIIKGRGKYGACEFLGIDSYSKSRSYGYRHESTGKKKKWEKKKKKIN